MRAPPSFHTTLVLTLALGCASKLDRPERFAATVKKYSGSAGSSGASGTKPASADDDAGPSPDAGKAAPPSCAIQIFKTTCGMPGCHAKGAPQIDLVSDGVTARMLDKKSQSAICKDRVYIDTRGMSSLLLDKLAASPPCGVKMPLTGMISTADVKCLSDWVKSLGGSVPDAGAMP